MVLEQSGGASVGAGATQSGADKTSALPKSNGNGAESTGPQIPKHSFPVEALTEEAKDILCNQFKLINQMRNNMCEGIRLSRPYGCDHYSDIVDVQEHAEDLKGALLTFMLHRGQMKGKYGF